MAVELQICLTGLITFVPDPSNERLVALLPVTGGMGNAGVHQHHAELIFDRKYLGAATLGHQEHDGQATPETPLMERIPLGRTELNFSQARGSGDIFSPPPEAMPLDKLTRRPLDRGQIGEAPRFSVFAQVILPGADTIEPGERARWLVGGKVTTLTNKVVWTRALPEDERTVLVWIRYLGSAEYKVLRLTAPAAETRIHLNIDHLPDAQDEPQSASLGYEAVHFASYFELYRPPAPSVTIPILAEAPAANTFTCMVSQVPVE